MDPKTVSISHEAYMERMAKGPEPDMVNSPPHYNTSDEIECIDAIKAALGPEGFNAYCRGNALKYVWRSPHKHKEANQDLEKAVWYINRILKETKDT